MVELPVLERIHSFVEVDQVLTDEAAQAESERCLFCGMTCYSMDTKAVGLLASDDDRVESKAA